MEGSPSKRKRIDENDSQEGASKNCESSDQTKSVAHLQNATVNLFGNADEEKFVNELETQLKLSNGKEHSPPETKTSTQNVMEIDLESSNKDKDIEREFKIDLVKSKAIVTFLEMDNEFYFIPMAFFYDSAKYIERFPQPPKTTKFEFGLENSELFHILVAQDGDNDKLWSTCFKMGTEPAISKSPQLKVEILDKKLYGWFDFSEMTADSKCIAYLIRYYSHYYIERLDPEIEDGNKIEHIVWPDEFYTIAVGLLSSDGESVVNFVSKTFKSVNNAKFMEPDRIIYLEPKIEEPNVEQQIIYENVDLLEQNEVDSQEGISNNIVTHENVDVLSENVVETMPLVNDSVPSNIDMVSSLRNKVNIDKEPILLLQHSSIKCKVEFKCSGTNESSKYRFVLVKLDSLENGFRSSGIINQDYYEFNELEPGCHHIVSVELRNPFDENRIVCCRSKSFRACFSKDEMRQLEDRAISINRQQAEKDNKAEMEEVKYLQIYRRESDWKLITDFLHKGLHRPSGNPACAIISEQQAMGIWGGLKLHRGQLPTASPFGDRCFLVELRKLFKLDEFNLYFAGVSCYHGTLENHWSIVVMCRKDSGSDKFYKKNYNQLDPFNNKFLEARLEEGTNNLLFYTMTSLHVNVFYTEDIPIDLGVFSPNLIRYLGHTGSGDGFYRQKGHEPNCPYCNLYPPKQSNNDGNQLESSVANTSNKTI